MAGGTLARTPHFALHRLALAAAVVPTPVPVSSDMDTEGEKMRPGSSSPLFEDKGVWMGAMVPKRWAKRAVTRNAIKRQIYIASSLAEVDLADAAHVVRLRAGFDIKSFPSATSDALKQSVRLELGQLFASALRSQKMKSPLLAVPGNTVGGTSERPPEKPFEESTEEPPGKARTRSEEAIAKSATTNR